MTGLVGDLRVHAVMRTAVTVGGEAVTSPEHGVSQCHLRWPMCKRIPSGCLIEESCALTDLALLLNCYTKEKLQ